MKLNVRAYVSGYMEDDWVIQTAMSNNITVYSEFLPHLIGGNVIDDSTHIYTNPRNLVLDCSMASCIMEYFVMLIEYDENWENPEVVVNKIYHGAPSDFIDLTMLARKHKYQFQDNLNYSVLVGPGSNIIIDPATWYINSKFRIEPKTVSANE